MKTPCWIARDIDGDIYLHFSKPIEDYVTPKFWVSDDYVNVSKTVLDNKFINLPPGSEPVELELSKIS